MLKDIWTNIDVCDVVWERLRIGCVSFILTAWLDVIGQLLFNIFTGGQFLTFCPILVYA
jgi:hypothetical protein